MKFIILILLIVTVCNSRKHKRLRHTDRMEAEDVIDKYLHNIKEDSSDADEYWKKCQPGVKLEVGKRIVGGVLSRRHAWPWQIRLLKESKTDGSFHAICGGSIVSPEYILTAAHCVTDAAKKITHPASLFKITAGDYQTDTKTDGKTQTVKVQAIYVHPDHNRSIKDEADMALLKLTHKLTFNDNVTNVCFPVKPTQEGEYCYATGWGDTKSTEIRTILRQVRLPIISQKHCSHLEYQDSVIPGMICAGYLEGGYDTCQGDSGGPLVCQSPADKEENKWRVQGVTSWGEGCAQPKFPGVYADVYFYRGWVSQYVKM